MDPLVERLNNYMKYYMKYNVSPGYSYVLLTEAATRITELQAQLKEAREALKPFADEAKWNGLGDFNLTLGDLRRAARALETVKPRD